MCKVNFNKNFNIEYNIIDIDLTYKFKYIVNIVDPVYIGLLI